MGYQKVFNKPYEEGYKNLPDKSTPVTAEILNMQDDTFESVEDYLENLTDGMPTDSFIELLQDYVPQVNPATTGDEPLLTGLSVGTAVYRIPGGSAEKTEYTPNSIVKSNNVQDAIDELVGMKKQGTYQIKIDTIRNSGTSANIIVSVESKGISEDCKVSDFTADTKRVVDGISVKLNSNKWEIYAEKKCYYNGNTFEKGSLIDSWYVSNVKHYIVETEEGEQLPIVAFREQVETTHTTTERTIPNASDGNIVSLSLVGATTQGANPSPSNPQPINGFSGEMGTHGGKNLLNCNGLTEQTSQGVTFTPHYSNGQLEYININGTTSSNNAWYKLNNNFPLANNIFSIGKNYKNVYMAIYASDDSTALYRRDDFNEESVTINKTSDNTNVYIYCLGGNTYNNVKIYPMIRLATETDATYEPYKASTIHTFPLYSIGDVKDELRVYRDGSGEYTKRTFKWIFDGNEGWNIGSIASKQYIYTRARYSEYIAPNDNTEIGLVKSNIAKASDRSSMTENTVVIQSKDYPVLGFVFAQDSFTSDTWKSFIKDNYVILALATPTTQKLTPSEVAEILKLKTYQGKTYIDAENVEFNLEYFADSEIGQSLADVNSKVESNAVEIATLKEEIENQNYTNLSFTGTSVAVGRCYVKNGIAYVNAYLVASSAEVVISNFPIPLTETYIPLISDNVNSSNKIMSLKANTSSITRSGLTVGQSYAINCSYIIS